ncbi:TM0106 family RecB-like putative nuclease [Luteipulveratus flavus]|uniref:TM0106 family RecB-like putative nuclease n=1 Tax=Luteipulveratus flavus TaxID=3031728 RepID=A0ABT6C8N9_9MICO|nr:bifunctional RecB family nuclease/DEAD/DEAH box helicase [Luteipulveratus sp. YIM 133296]MDF8265238.1 TM0106 family RecB-like putative nuclease [Luteipulveratus sp. YIM 133296]
MFLLRDDARLVLSPSDLRLAAQCEFALVRELDVTLGRMPRPAPADEAMLTRLQELGDATERQELLRLSAAHPGRVRQFPRPEYDLASLTAAHEQTIAALRSPDTDVVYQATFFDGGFVGHADFLVRTEAGWLVCDTKLARHANVPALLQIAAYASQLRDAGVPTAPLARLVLGSGLTSDHLLDDILPVYAARRERLTALLAEHAAETGVARWGDPRRLACGRCEVCEAEAEVARDVLLVAGVRLPQRRRLREAGVTTIEQLAVRTEPVPDVRAATLDRLREQARLQLVQESDPEGRVVAEVTSPEALHAMPAPSDGDVFFDFEGDPLWSERGSHDWGLEYLFGLVEIDGVDLAGGQPPRFRAFWAHDRVQEKQALIDFVAHLHERRRRWPDLHVYHYAPYEKSALLRLAARHGVCEDDIDQFLRDGVFVDLYAVVRSAIRVSQRSYSIKRLEPLYMGGRTAAVAKGDDSIVAYHRFVLAREMGDDATAEQEIRDIAEYNEEDCVSTLLLRNWLLARGAEAAVGVSGPNGSTAAPLVGDGSAPSTTPHTPSDSRIALMGLESALRAHLDGIRPQDRTPEQQAVAMVAATLLFHAREDKPYWWKHFDRLRLPVGEWVSDAGVFVVQRSEVAQDWHRDSPRKRPRRRIRLTGEPMGGVLLEPGVEVSAVYAAPPPLGVPLLPGHLNARSSATVSVLDARDVIASNGRVHQVLTVEELMPKDGEEHRAVPVALVPSAVVATKNIDAALERLARRVGESWPDLPQEAAVDVLLRRPPRLRSGSALPAVGEGEDRHIRAIEAALLDLDRSALSVQGPPGTGKTYVASQVIARLVREHGWRVGVCAQSHAAIENVLAAVVAAGLEPERAGKVTRDAEQPTWTDLAAADELAGFAAEQEGGYVIGGTAWDLTHPSRVEPGQLDLLVIDEAGQYSLAKTLAVAQSADRLLLLGDPQQLPQVSQGTHPEPVDLSALGWVIRAEHDDERVLPASHGYFLETTWRMHPALTEPVSRLAYEGRLRSHEDRTAKRTLEGVDPGLHVRLVDHRDRARWSPEEAQVVLDLARDHLGRAWRESPEEPPRPLTEADVLVITPYNAQVGTLRAALDEAGLRGVAVGTVDKFQGREAPVAIVSMASSAHADVPRGLAFLLDRHRLNVAVSRAQYAAYLVRSRVLTDVAPRSPEELTALGAFLGLCERAVSTVSVPVPLDDERAQASPLSP